MAPQMIKKRVVSKGGEAAKEDVPAETNGLVEVDGKVRIVVVEVAGMDVVVVVIVVGIGVGAEEGHVFYQKSKY